MSNRKSPDDMSAAKRWARNSFVRALCRNQMITYRLAEIAGAPEKKRAAELAAWLKEYHLEAIRWVKTFAELAVARRAGKNKDTWLYVPHEKYDPEPMTYMTAPIKSAQGEATIQYPSRGAIRFDAAAELSDIVVYTVAPRKVWYGQIMDAIETRVDAFLDAQAEKAPYKPDTRERESDERARYDWFVWSLCLRWENKKIAAEHNARRKTTVSPGRVSKVLVEIAGYLDVPASRLPRPQGGRPQGSKTKVTTHNIVHKPTT